MSISHLTEKKICLKTAIPAGNHWSGIIRRGQVLRLLNQSGSANVAMVMHHQHDLLERYNMADTLKAQHTFYLTAGHVCYSDMGRIFCAIIQDDIGWHDTVCGLSDAESIRQRFGATSYQQQRNAMFRNSRDGLLIELAKYGLGVRDLGNTINWFSKVTVDTEGQLHYVQAHSLAGSKVDLRFAMNTLVAISTAPHPLDSRSDYPNGQVEIMIWQADQGDNDVSCRNHCPENQRGFINTDAYYCEA